MSLAFDGENGTITVPTAAVSSLVTRAVERVSGARVRRGRRHLEVHVVDGRLRVSLEIAARYGLVLPELARAVQQQVHDVLASMCGLEVEVVEVAVEGVE